MVEQPPSSTEAAPSRRMVCGYEIELLPTWWLQVHRFFKTRLEREGALVKVDLLPLSNLPPDVDLLIVPPDALAAAREHAPHVECVAITAEDYPKQVAEILAHLRGRGWYAVRESAQMDQPQPKIVRHLGYEKID